MAAHRYWRVYITANNGNTLTAFSVVRFFFTTNEEVAISGGTASASSIYSSTYNADKAIDGNSTTEWVNNADMPCWWMYDFGSGNEKTVNAVLIQIYTIGGAPKDFTFDWSDNGSSWTSMITVSGSSAWATNEARIFWIPTSGLILNTITQRDMVDGGSLSIIEPVTRMNAVPPQRRQVRLYDRTCGRLIRTQWSDFVTGEVNFQNLRVGSFDLLAHDHTYEFEAVAISDRESTVDGLRP